MDSSKKKLKLIPLHRFWKIMDTPSKVLYLVLFSALLLSAVAVFVASQNPSQWVVDIQEFRAPEQERIELRTYENQYRTMQTDMAAWKEDVAFLATPITPQPWIIISFILVQMIGWAFLLTAATYIRSFLAYVAFFLYAMAIFLAKAFDAISPDQSMLFNAGHAILVFVPAYLFQQNILRWNFALRLLLLTVLTAVPFTVPYFYRDWVGLHDITVTMYPLLAFVTIIYLVFISKDLSQLVFFAGTNLPQKRFRATGLVFIGVFMPLIALEFLMLHNAMGWDFLAEAKDFPIKPLHVLAAITLVMPGLNQNLIPVLKDQMDNRSFSFLITAFGVVSMSGIFLQVALGDYLYAYAVDRLFAMLLFFTTVLHVFYMYYNFGPMIRERMNLYFLTMMPRRLMFFFVVVATVGASFALDASDGMKTQKLLQAVSFNRYADQEMLAGRKLEAVNLYLAATDFAEGSVKGNYNQAMLLIQMDGDLYHARKCLKRASSFIPFPPAWINLGNLELNAGSPRQAKFYLRQGYEQVPDPYLSSNLGLCYQILEEPDSAIMAYKDAMLLKADEPAFYANIGRVYTQYGRIEPAVQFLESGLQLEKAHPSVVTNALFLNLRHGTELKVTPEIVAKLDTTASRNARFNMALERYKTRHFEEAAKLIEALTKESETPDVLLLDGMLKFDSGDIEGAISRMKFLDVNHPSYKAFTKHFLGVAFFGIGVPELASVYFGESVENGRQDDLLNKALMEIDRGDHDQGFTLLNMARSQDSTLVEAVAREEALLQIANGEYFFAGLGFDLNALTPSEWVRAGIYAGQKGNKPAALEAFRRAIEKDSSSVAPYLEMGRISLRLGDSLALENLSAGLKKDEGHIPLRIEVARAFLLRGDVSSAETFANNIKKEKPDDMGLKILLPEIMLAKGDTAAAIKEYQALYKMQPLNPRVVLGLAEIMRKKRMDFDGQNLLAEVLAINPRNADYWYEIALFERLLDRTEEVAKAASRAMQLATDPMRMKQIGVEFAAELKAFPPQPEEVE